MPDVVVTDAGEADTAAIAAITAATGQRDEWSRANPAYVRHLLEHGRIVVAQLGGEVVGFGAVLQLGAGSDAISLLCDPLVDPVAHGRGCGLAMLAVCR